tara:strand:+ start:570 stop:1001 length:432 start_codon:yes stop_codon:yes gene_type:complete
MTGFAGAALALLIQLVPQATPAWTWTLYDDNPLVLANEVPDTARLRSTFECEPGSSVVRLSLYPSTPASGFARVSAGSSTTTAPFEPAGGNGLRVILRSDHPVFAAFAADGHLAVMIGEEKRDIEVQRAHLAKLRRFTELCAS